MYSKEGIVRNETGLHNTAAAIFIQKANEFSSQIWVEVEERRGRRARQSYQSVDVLTGAVELSDPASGELIFEPVEDQQ